ncbi:MAG: AIR synthase-related protein, partial [Cyclobacteriaceae bacterium]
SKVAGWKEVHAMTDVTGFGLGGHLTEMCKGSRVSARIDFVKVPVFGFVPRYLELECIPGGTHRNWDSYGNHIKLENPTEKFILADPQTSGGLLMAVDPKAARAFEKKMAEEGYPLEAFGQIVPEQEWTVSVR